MKLFLLSALLLTLVHSTPSLDAYLEQEAVRTCPSWLPLPLWRALDPTPAELHPPEPEPYEYEPCKLEVVPVLGLLCIITAGENGARQTALPCILYTPKQKLSLLIVHCFLSAMCILAIYHRTQPPQPQASSSFEKSSRDSAPLDEERKPMY
jgi:hypothetical protein